MSRNKRPANPRRVTMGDLALLSRKLEDMAADWETYGLCLGISQDQINDIVAKKRDVKKDVTKCMKDLLMFWTRENSNPTWEQLHTAAKRMNLNALAGDIKEEHDLNGKVDLSEGNISTVVQLLDPAVARWHSFGLQMGINPNQLDKIAGEAHVFLEDMLKLYITLKEEEATIDHLITTIRCHLIQNNALADRLCEDTELQQHYAYQDSRDQLDHATGNEEHLMHTNVPITIDVKPTNYGMNEESAPVKIDAQLTDHLTDEHSGKGPAQHQNNRQTDPEPRSSEISQEPIPCIMEPGPHQTSRDRPQPHAEIRERVPRSQSLNKAMKPQIEPSTHEGQGAAISRFNFFVPGAVLTWIQKYPKSTVVLVTCSLAIYLTYHYNVLQYFMQ